MNPLKQTMLTLKCINSIKPILKEEYGSKWLPFFMKSFIRGSKIYGTTKWASNKDNKEGSYIKSVSIVSGIYDCLKESREKDIALTIIEKIMYTLTHTTDSFEAKINNIHAINNPLLRWSKFYEKAVTTGVIQFNKIELLSHGQNRIHLRVKRCLFHDYFTEVGQAELTRFICHADKHSQAYLFEEYDFHRDDSWENTIAHDCAHCEYIWDMKEDYKDKNFVEDPELQIYDYEEELPLLFKKMKPEPKPVTMTITELTEQLDRAVKE